MTPITTILRRAAASLALLLTAPAAYAAGTVAGTTVTNTATVNYQVAGTPLITTDDDSFVVDRKILLTVAEVGGVANIVASNTIDKAITFTLTNGSNDTLDFNLASGQFASLAAVLGGTDSFDATGTIRFFVETAGAGFSITDDTLVTFIDDLAPDAVRTIYLVGNIPTPLVNGDRAGLTLKAIAHDRGAASTLGTILTQTAGADTQNGTPDIVFGDIAGPAIGGDAARDGQHSDDGSFLVDVTTLAVTKTSRVTTDPINLAVNPKAIPGATVDYCLVMINTGGQTITNVAMVDILPIQVTYVAGSLFSGVTIDGSNLCDLSSGTAEDDDATGADETDPNGGSFNTGTRTVAATIGSLATTAKIGVRFKVTIN